MGVRTGVVATVAAALLTVACAGGDAADGGGPARYEATFAVERGAEAPDWWDQVTVTIDLPDDGQALARVAGAGRDLAYVAVDGDDVLATLRTSRLAAAAGWSMDDLAAAANAVDSPQVAADPLRTAGDVAGWGELAAAAEWAPVWCAVQAAADAPLPDGCTAAGHRRWRAGGVLATVAPVRADEHLPWDGPGSGDGDLVEVAAVTRFVDRWQSGSFADVTALPAAGGPLFDPVGTLTGLLWDAAAGDEVDVPAGVQVSWLPDGALEGRYGPTVVCFPLGADAPTPGPCP